MENLLRKGLKRYSEVGLLRVIGKSARFSGRKVNDTTKQVSGAVEYHQEQNASVKGCIRALREGFDPKYYFFLGLDTRDSKLYLKNNRPISEANRDTSSVLYDKFAIYNIFSDFESKFPSLYGTIHSGRYEPQNDNESETLRDAVDTYGVIIGKPFNGYEGRDIFKIEKLDDAYLINGERASANDVDNLQASLNEDFIITECIEQHSYSSEIAPWGVNTIRLLTALDPETGEVHVVRAAHRFSTEESAPTDNWQNGGVAAPIDDETGELQSIVVLRNGRRAEIESHPGTEQAVSGVDIPMWNEVCNMATQAHKKYQMAVLIGWDIAITEEGPMFLEASGGPGINILQLGGGLLEEDVVRRIFEDREVSSP